MCPHNFRLRQSCIIVTQWKDDTPTSHPHDYVISVSQDFLLNMYLSSGLFRGKENSPLKSKDHDFSTCVSQHSILEEYTQTLT